MRLLKSTVHPQLTNLAGVSLERTATRAIVIKGDRILLMYTARYEDYSLPGGGVDEGEDLISGLKRELSEETGAQNIRNIRPFGCYEEYRPWYKNDADYMHMRSYCYLCDIDDELGQNALEHYEIRNGMDVRWMNIDEAIAHNQKTIASNPKAGLSVERETYLLQCIRQECMASFALDV